MPTDPALPTWWPLTFDNDAPPSTGIGTPPFATVKDMRKRTKVPCDYRVWDEAPGENGTMVECDTMLEVFAVLIEIARRKAPHTLPPSYLAE